MRVRKAYFLLRRPRHVTSTPPGLPSTADSVWSAWPAALRREEPGDCWPVPASSGERSACPAAGRTARLLDGAGHRKPAYPVESGPTSLSSPSPAWLVLFLIMIRRDLIVRTSLLPLVDDPAISITTTASTSLCLATPPQDCPLPPPTHGPTCNLPPTWLISSGNVSIRCPTQIPGRTLWEVQWQRATGSRAACLTVMLFALMRTEFDRQPIRRWSGPSTGTWSIGQWENI